MFQNPALVRAMARDRVVELQQAAGPAPRGRRARRAPSTIRRATGWLLVDVGLRLALPRRPASHSLARHP
jgi:hypothetical protein